MRRRHVSQEAVSFVLINFHTVRPAQPRVRARPAEIYIGTYDERELKVYVEIGSQPPLVKTVAWIRQ